MMSQDRSEGQGGKLDNLQAPGRNVALAAMIDHTLLRPGATADEIQKLCDTARDYGFASVCVRPEFVALSAKLLAGSGVKVCTVVGFPADTAAADVSRLGSAPTADKLLETRKALAAGAQEVDMVINVGALKAGRAEQVSHEIKALAELCHRGAALLKVIIETCLLTDDEKVRACRAAAGAGADFVKTSTGFSTGGATAADVALMRRTVGPAMGVKASGGISDAAAAEAMIAAGATRLGTSKSVAIIDGLPAQQQGGY